MKHNVKYWALALVLALSLSSLSGCGVFFPQPTPTPIPTNTPEPPTPTSIPTDTPVPTATIVPTLPPTNTPFPTFPPQPSATNTPTNQKPIYIYFIQKKTGGTVACGDSLVALTSGQYRTDKLEPDIETALRQLFIWHQANFGELYNALYLSNLSVVEVEIDAGGKIVVDLSGEVEVSEDKCDKSRIFAQIVATIRQFPGVSGNPSIS
ncbi:MAG: GerMN domain-containing protein, partial [Anaerolineales bacterium]|nr:GerMN domain-containing protein [Anaerolineales bacterium]